MESHNPRTFKEPGKAAGRGIGISGGAFRGLVAFDESDNLPGYQALLIQPRRHRQPFFTQEGGVEHLRLVTCAKIT